MKAGAPKVLGGAGGGLKVGGGANSRPVMTPEKELFASVKVPLMPVTVEARVTRGSNVEEAGGSDAAAVQGEGIGVGQGGGREAQAQDENRGCCNEMVVG